MAHVGLFRENYHLGPYKRQPGNSAVWYPEIRRKRHNVNGLGLRAWGLGFRVL